MTTSIKRKLFVQLENHLTKPEISLIVGPRQAGKTTLMEQLQDELVKKKEKTLFLSLDNDSDRTFFTSQDRLIEKIQLEIGKNHGYVFIDEIQRKIDAGLFLKGLYDRNLPYKLVVSGSGSIELKEKIHESLAGRKRLFELSTVNFIEFVNFKTDYRYEKNLADFFPIEGKRLLMLLEEYLQFGGYPKVILADTVEEKRHTMAELYQSYLERDIGYLLKVVKTDSFTALVRLMASQIGNLVNFSELAKTLGISLPTVKEYLWYLEKTFLMSRVTPYFKNVRKEIIKAPIFYFCDLGMRNYALGTFGLTPVGKESGFLFQNFVYLILKEKIQETPLQVHFWRTTDRAEVDFVVDTVREVIPIEVKYSKLSPRQNITRSFRSFLAKYSPAKGYVVHLGKDWEKEVYSIPIFFLSYHAFLFQKL